LRGAEERLRDGHRVGARPAREVRRAARQRRHAQLRSRRVCSGRVGDAGVRGCGRRRASERQLAARRRRSRRDHERRTNRPVRQAARARAPSRRGGRAHARRHPRVPGDLGRRSESAAGASRSRHGAPAAARAPRPNRAGRRRGSDALRRLLWSGRSMTAGDLVLSVDCSTTACKAIVWDAAGGEVASGRQGFPLLTPVPDGYEQDAGDWSSALFAAIGEAVRQLTPERRRAIRALGLTHQRETFVLTDRGGQPLLPAVVWMDSRCRRHVELAQARLDPDEIHRISGKPVCTTPSLYKLMFLLAEHPEVARQAPMVLDVHGYLAFALTGRFATSLASADPTGLIDMQARDWSPELLELAGIGRAQLAELFAPGAVF